MKRTLKALAAYTRRDTAAARWLERGWYGAKRMSAHVIPDRWFVSLYYLAHTGRLPNLRRPTAFGEKVQWLKLHYRPRTLIQLVDKLEVRSYVANRVGPELLVPLHATYHAVDEIDFEALPDAFVLKPTHGSGWVIVCERRQTFDWQRARARLALWMRRNYYYHAREWAYKHVPPRILCERLLVDERGRLPADFKFYCFDGDPELVQVDVDRFADHRRNFYDLSWNRLDLEMLYQPADHDVPRPSRLADMVEVSRRLSRGLPFCRVDLYAIGSTIYFGELTFSPDNGVAPLRPNAHERAFGDRLELPAIG